MVERQITRVISMCQNEKKKYPLFHSLYLILIITYLYTIYHIPIVQYFHTSTTNPYHSRLIQTFIQDTTEVFTYRFLQAANWTTNPTGISLNCCQTKEGHAGQALLYSSNRLLVTCMLLFGMGPRRGLLYLLISLNWFHCAGLLWIIVHQITSLNE